MRVNVRSERDITFWCYICRGSLLGGTKIYRREGKYFLPTDIILLSVIITDGIDSVDNAIGIYRLDCRRNLYNFEKEKQCDNVQFF